MKDQKDQKCDKKQEALNTQPEFHSDIEQASINLVSFR